MTRQSRGLLIARTCEYGAFFNPRNVRNGGSSDNCNAHFSEAINPSVSCRRSEASWRRLEVSSAMPQPHSTSSAPFQRAMSATIADTTG
eukprot:3498599-Amphidinium_carterae.1